jgi:Domain of unknown function (DUF4198)
MTSGRVIRVAGVCLAFMLAFARVGISHDFWLVPNAFKLAAGDEVTILGRTSSSFPSSVGAVTPDRVADARVISSDRIKNIGTPDVTGESLRLRFSAMQAGQKVVAVRIHPRDIRESPESFRRYLSLEGAPEMLERYRREGRLPTDSVTRRYAKYAKTVLEVGTGGPRSFTRSVGHPVEFMPLSDPGDLSVGDEFRVRLLFQGEGLPGAKAHAGVAESLADEGPLHDEEMTTDSDGVLTVRVEHGGIWNVRALVIVPAEDGSSADWDVHWATLVFPVETSGSQMSAKF